MKVKFLKQHLSYKKDGVYDVDEGLGNYLTRVKAAEEVAGKAEKKAPEKESPAKVETKTAPSKEVVVRTKKAPVKQSKKH